MKRGLLLAVTGGFIVAGLLCGSKGAARTDGRAPRASASIAGTQEEAAPAAGAQQRQAPPANGSEGQGPVEKTPRAINPHGEPTPDCKLCHSEESWEVGGTVQDFDHASTGFPLAGLHVHVACRACHKQPVFSHIGIRCADCHMDAHKGRLGPACEDCHDSRGWVERTQRLRDHDMTRLPLVGAHATVDCDACHEGAVREDYVGTSYECIACHREAYESTADPDHVAAGFSTDCQQCHAIFAATWGRGDFVHSPRFPLTGAHARTACIECHADGFAGAPTDCEACHRADYDATTDPAHLAAGFPTECAACHSMSSWQPASFNHDASSFPLTGAHRNAGCTACHASGYSGTPTACYACHRADYDGTTDPDHAAANFPTDCVTCHSTTAWQPSTWNHETLFPINSGTHGNVSCTECHVVPADYGTFECILCHAHSRSSTDGDHRGVNNYQYLSSACYQCHPRGRG